MCIPRRGKRNLCHRIVKRWNFHFSWTTAVVKFMKCEIIIIQISLNCFQNTCNLHILCFRYCYLKGNICSLCTIFVSLHCANVIFSFIFVKRELFIKDNGTLRILSIKKSSPKNYVKSVSAWCVLNWLQHPWLSSPPLQ